MFNSLVRYMAYAEAKNAHYMRNREKYIKQSAEKRDYLRTVLRELKDASCMDCGIKYPHYVMHFDHRDGETKVNNLGNLVNNGSERILREEAAKCDLVCANCHAERTYQRGYKNQYS